MSKGGGLSTIFFTLQGKQSSRFFRIVATIGGAASVITVVLLSIGDPHGRAWQESAIAAGMMIIMLCLLLLGVRYLAQLPRKDGKAQGVFGVFKKILLYYVLIGVPVIVFVILVVLFVK